MAALVRIVTRFDQLLTRALKFLTVTLFIALLAILSFNVVARFLPFSPSLEWMDEIVELCISSLVFYGAAALWMVKGHFSAGNWIAKVTRDPRLISLYRVGVELVSLLFIGVFFRYSLQLVLKSQEVTAVFQIPKAVLYSSMPVSAGIMVLYSVGTVLVELAGVFGRKT
jgi:TRAP-type C4-dicarboxylate transport system permease small subunit